MRKSRAQSLEQQVAEAPSKDTLKLPHDPIGEVAIIAAVIVSADARRRCLALSPDLFVGPGHADVWRALQDIFARGLHYDPATIRQVSGGAVDPELLDGYVAARPELPPNLDAFVEQLKWDAARVAAAKKEIPELLEAIRDLRAAPDKVRALAKAVGSAFDGHGSGRFRRSTEEIVAEHRETLTRRRTGQAVFPYGFHGLDLFGPGDRDERHGLDLAGTPRMIPGAAPGMTTVVTGASGSGKTTSVARMVLAWSNAGRRTLWGAWEVKDAMNLELLATLSLGWHRGDVLTGSFSEEEEEELLAEMARLGQYVRFLDLPFDRRKGERSRSNDQNLDLIQQEIADVDPDEFVADLFQRCLVRKSPEDQESAVNRFQAMMQEERCHGTIVHQLLLKGDEISRSVDQRPSKELLKGSMAYFEVPDTVLAWYRPAFHKSVPDDKIECHILKQRFGKFPQCVEFDWDPEYGSIENGHTIEVQRPGEQASADTFLDEAARATSKKHKRRRL